MISRRKMLTGAAAIVAVPSVVVDHPRNLVSGLDPASSPSRMVASVIFRGIDCLRECRFEPVELAVFEDGTYEVASEDDRSLLDAYLNEIGKASRGVEI